jgi:hypothetical protein
MERFDHQSEEGIVELGVASVETKGLAPVGEFIGGPNAEGLSDE